MSEIQLLQTLTDLLFALYTLLLVLIYWMYSGEKKQKELYKKLNDDLCRKLLERSLKGER